MQVPLFLQHCCKLQQLELSTNRISEMEQTDWAAFQALESLNMANNQITQLIPDGFTQLPRLTELNFENNAISLVPPLLSRCPALRTLLIAGNPQRAVQTHVIAQGSLAVLANLSKKMPPPDVPPPNVPPTKPIQHNCSTGGDQPGQPPSVTPQTATLIELAPATSSGAGRANVGIATHNNGYFQMQQLKDDISMLEAQLEGPLSQAKRFAVKKEIAKKRALRIRLERASSG